MNGVNFKLVRLLSHVCGATVRQMIAGLPSAAMAVSEERPPVNDRITGVFRPGRRGQDRRSRQVEEYVAWINSHLKKRPRSPLIYDLRSLQDGVTLVHLVEVLSQREVGGVDPNPSTPLAKAANLEAAVTFLCETGVQLPATAARDLRDGSLKGTLKVILALAQRYHPMSIRHSVNRGRNQLVKHSGGRDSAASTPYCSTYSPVQQVIMADESLSQEEYGAEGGASTGHHTPAPFHPYYEPTKGSEESEQTHLVPAAGVPSPEFGGVSPIPSMSSFVPASRSYPNARDTPISGFTGVSGVRPYTDSMISPPATGSSGDQSPAPPPAPAVDTPLPSLDNAMVDITGIKGHLLQLYALLRDNPDGQEADSTTLTDHSWSSSELLGQNGSYMTPLLEEGPKVHQLRDDIATLQSECQMLQEMAEGKEDMIRQLKADILRLDYKTETEREELRNMVSEKQLVINELDLRLEERSVFAAEQQKKLEQLEEELQQQQKLRTESLRELKEKETEIADLKATASRGIFRTSQVDSLSAEVDVIRQSMSVLRKEAQSAQHKPLDRLEEAVSHLMDHINAMATRRARHERQKDRDRRQARMAVESTPTKSMETVKVIYTLNEDDTPYRITVPYCGPHGPTLADFKAAFGRKGHFKYFFKSTEEGSAVKVEVTDDAATLPTAGGRYVAWVTTS